MDRTQKKIRYGIIGFGNFAERAILPAMRLSRNSELVAIQKRSFEAVKAKAIEHEIPMAFDSVEELVSAPEIDAVYIVSANAAHCPETLLAAEAKKHILVEKPMALDAAEATRMIEACRANGVVFMVGHMLRFSPLLIRMRELVASGDIGPISSVRSEFIYDAGNSKREWLYDMKAAGGGPTVDIAVHCLDALRFVLGEEVVATHARLAPMPTDTRTESSSLLSLQFSSGTIGSIYTSFEAPIRETFIQCIGRKAVLSAYGFTHGDSSPSLKIVWGEEGKTVRTVEEHFQVPNLYEAEISHLSECILTGCAPVLSGENGLQNQLVLDAAMAHA